MFRFAIRRENVDQGHAPRLMLTRAETRTHRSVGPGCQVVRDGSVERVVLSGDWTLAHIDEVYAVVAACKPSGRAVVIDAAGIGLLDTSGALSVVRLASQIGVSPTSLVGATAAHRVLIDEVAQASGRTALAEDPEPRQSFFGAIGKAALGVTAVFRDALRLTDFLGQVAAALGRVMLRPWTFRGTAFVHQLQQTGLTAVPIIALVCFLIGAVVMQQGAQQLRTFGAEALAVDMLGILTLREVGVLLAAVMVAGRSASAFTAQIGTMKTREEIDAMRTIGIDPIETLVLPRMLALLLALPLLVFIANVMALAGGALAAKLYLNLDIPIFLQRLNSAVDSKHFYVGLIKAPFAALVIGLVGCMEGMAVKGSAESVGTQVTTAVVKAIFLVLVLDGVFAIFLSASGF